MKTTKLKSIAIVSLIAGAVFTPIISYACYNQFSDRPKPQSVKVEAKKEVKPETPKEATATPVEEPKVVATEAKPKPVAPTKPKALSESKKKNYESSPGGVSAISLSGSGANVQWSTSGTAAMGFKVVWSKTPGPTYPTRWDGAKDKYHYLSDPSAAADTISAFEGPGIYYVRVCEYLGGKCGVYSNQITVNL